MGCRLRTIPAQTTPIEKEITMIETKNLRRTFGKRVAVDDVTLTVEKGTICGLLGPNGAGKTTLLRILTGQIDPDNGMAQVAGYDVVRQRTDLKQIMGVVFDVPNLYERLSAEQNLEFACRLYRVPFARVPEVLQVVGLLERAKEAVNTYSTGMKQRLLIARALLHQPQVLFLDEPTRGLDPMSAYEVRETVMELRERGTTVLLTTHLMDEADQWCDQLALMVAGRLLVQDTPHRLKAAYGDATTPLATVFRRVVEMASTPPQEEAL